MKILTEEERNILHRVNLCIDDLNELEKALCSDGGYTSQDLENDLKLAIKYLGLSLEKEAASLGKRAVEKELAELPDQE